MKRDKNKHKKVEAGKEAYTQLLAGLEAVAHIHTAVPDHATIRDSIHHLRTLLQRISTYEIAAKALSLPPNKTVAGSESRDTSPFSNDDTRSSSQQHRDRMDREGVMLWNRSTALKQAYFTQNSDTNETAGNDDKLLLVGITRFAAARLVDLGTESRDDNLDCARLLELYIKATQDLCASSSLKDAQEACELAAVLFQQLKPANVDDIASGALTARSRLSVNYYLCRVRLAEKQQNHQMADFMIKEATKETFLLDCSARDIEHIASECYSVAVAILGNSPTGTFKAVDEAPEAAQKSSVRSRVTGAATNTVEHPKDSAHIIRSQRACEWLRRAVILLEREDILEPLPGRLPGPAHGRCKTLYVKSIKATAQTYLEIDSRPQSDSFRKAEAAINEVLKQENDSKLWRTKMRLLVKRNATESDLISNIATCMKDIELTEAGVAGILKELLQLPVTRKASLLACLKHTVKHLLLRSQDGGQSWVYLCLVAICQRLAPSSQDLDILVDILRTLDEAPDEIQLAPEAAFVCQSLIWKYGDTTYVAGDFQAAARWYITSTDAAFAALGKSNFSKARRKAALCLLRAHNVIEAQQLLHRHVNNSASDHYVLYLCALHQEGADNEAKRAIRAMVSSPDFAIEMLLWAAKQAQELGLTGLVIYVLTETLRFGERQSSESERLGSCIILRSLLRIAIDEYQPAGNESAHAAFDIVLDHFASAQRIINGMVYDASQAADVLWIYRHAIKFCLSEFGINDATRICRAHSIAADIAEATSAYGKCADHHYRADFPSENDVIVIKVATLMHQISTSDSRGPEVQNSLMLDAKELLVRIRHAHSSNDLCEIEAACMAACFEISLRLEDWNEAESLLAAGMEGGTALAFFQKAADAACKKAACPSSVVTKALEAVMERMQSTAADPTKISKFVRAIVASSLDRGDREHAAEHVNSALSYIRKVGKVYPRAEVEWLATSCWNVGVDIFPFEPSAAAYWCETALELAACIQGFSDTRNMMNRHYHLLASQYALTEDAVEDSGFL